MSDTNYSLDSESEVNGIIRQLHSELDAVTSERNALFRLLKRQHAADAGLYNMSHYCSKEEHEKWVEEHFDSHVEIGKVIAAAIIEGRMT